ncbi:MAG: hypothetical protein U0586_13255 [Candidatus Brocadiaceae bacterium]
MENLNIGKSVKGVRLAFNIETKVPKGLLIINLVEGLINGHPGLVMNTIIRSDKKSELVFEIDSLKGWLENAHTIQKYVFNNLINPTYIKSFK